MATVKQLRGAAHFNRLVAVDSKKMKQSEAKKHNELSSIFHLNLLLTCVLRLEDQVKSQLAIGAGACGGGISDHWMRGSERSISNAISSIDTVVRETTDLRQKLQEHSSRLVTLEMRVASHGQDRLPAVLPMFSSLQPTQMSEDISRRLTNAENGSNNIEFLIGETGRELNNVRQEVSSLKRQMDGTVDSMRRLERKNGVRRAQFNAQKRCSSRHRRICPTAANFHL
ncbi:hypothetical protein OS493_031622 [Desmophyllum pertusum]|uniref:Uncharacterized protein n=1 Tax=Desmophyllum pertusum TaxID=174260 RepID=A0A9X0CEA9_9CNID|nr:hypothetical protein OS493_031622 [Desmophyllum pertusum]